MKRIYILILYFISIHCLGQDHENILYGDLTGAFGNRQGSLSLDFFYNRTFLKSDKLEIGAGVRLTSYFGSSKYFSSAPSSLANDKFKNQNAPAE